MREKKQRKKRACYYYDNEVKNLKNAYLTALNKFKMTGSTLNKEDMTLKKKKKN